MRLAIICLAIFAFSSRVEKSEAVGGIGGTMGYEMNPIKFVYLDFDKTIAVNDYSEKVRNRVCVQKYPACDDFDESDAMLMVNEVADNPEDKMNLTDSLGGNERLLEMQTFLEELRNAKIPVKIVSTSWYPITEAQWQEYLFYVSNLLNLGFFKDEILAVEDPGKDLSADKGQRIRDDQKDFYTEDSREMLPFYSDVMFADDSTGNIISGLKVCNLLYMVERKGLGKSDMDYIKKSAGLF